VAPSKRSVMAPTICSVTGVYSTWRRGPNDRFVGIYHGENHAGMGLMEGNDINGAVWSVCMGLIDPTTGRVERRGEILRADKPKRPIAGRPHEVAALRIQGVGEPSMTPDRNDDYLLCYYTEASNRLDRRVCICLARSPIGEQGRPSSWKKHFQDRWDEPGLGGHETPILTAEGGDVGQAFVTFIKAWDRYVIVFCHQGFEDFQAGQSKQSGVYVATSRDGEKWTAPQRIMAAMTVPKTGRSFVQHPTLIVTSVTKDQLQGRLFYAFSPRWPMPHRLAASPITIRLQKSLTSDERSPSSVPADKGWTYLVDLPRIGLTQQYGWWSDRGELVLGGSSDKAADRKPLQFGGKPSTHGIYLHARPSDNAAITYRLRKQFSSFRSQVVIPEMFPWQGDPKTPLVFKIQGDGRLLWQSKPLGQKGDHQSCNVSVAGVDELSLLIDCPGPDNWGLAAWIEPQLSKR
jgi:hypothetical protein